MRIGYKISVVCTFLILLAGSGSELYAQDTLTVMTYNIYHGEQTYHPGQSNLEGIANVINRVKPDLVAFQEVDSATARSAKLHNGKPVDEVHRLAELTGMHGYFGKAMDYDGGGYGEGILTKKKLDSHGTALPIPAGGEPRALLTVSYPLSNGKQLTFGGTHLCHQFTENRVAQVKEINTHFHGSYRPAIVVGDFNFTPDAKPYPVMTSRWIDAAKYAGQVQPTFSYENPRIRIDYMYLSKGSTWQILSIRPLKVNNSDHMPLVAKIVVI